MDIFGIDRDLLAEEEAKIVKKWKLLTVKILIGPINNMFYVVEVDDNNPATVKGL